MNLFEKHQALLTDAVAALKSRTYFTPYPENPKAYSEDADAKAKAWISSIMNNNYTALPAAASGKWIGEEVSPFLQLGIGVNYPDYSIDELISNGVAAHATWSKQSLETRVGILIESLERIKQRFFDIAYATMHTTGQSYMMSFQASGPHANDRALEAIAMGYQELSRYTNETNWVKPMGKFDLTLKKNFKAIPKGLGLVIGCSTFPVWNTVPGLFACLVSGSACIVKPHAKAVLPIAIVVEELQKLFAEVGLDRSIVQLATDSQNEPKTKLLAEHAAVKQIDFTGNSSFGSYIESLPKTTFTEKAGVNSIILDSANDLKAVCSNIAFSASLYSGQMCTAPQNIFISADGVQTAEGVVSYADAVTALKDAFNGLIDHPKAGPGTLGAIQADLTFNRVKELASKGLTEVVNSKNIRNEEFPDARIASPIVVEINPNDPALYREECFGPIVFIIKTNSFEDSLNRAVELASEKGALTCGAYTTSLERQTKIEDAMNAIYVPVSFNFTGAAFINSHAAFSDFHLTGGNAAGNASFTNADFINKRVVWVGNRYM
ncbi:phenylacetic acid degradation protein PaaN [Bacteroidota bacterium]